MSNRLDLARTWPMWTLLVIAFISAIALRYAVRDHVTPDYLSFVGKWFEHLRTHGFGGLATVEANYNPPYLYLLAIGGPTPFDGLVWTKILAVAFDLVSAVGVAFILFRYWRAPLPAAAAGVAYLFIPEVWANSAVWGQSDSIYTAFLIWALWAVLERRDLLVWILFGIGLSFKLQIIFFLPLFGLVFFFQRHRWWKPLAGLGVYLLMLIPAIVAGRPIAQIVGVYLDQASTDVPLTRHSPNLYQWIPETLQPLMSTGGLYFALGAICLLGVAYLVRPAGWLQMAASFGLVAVFTLPAMHDRYNYAASAVVLMLSALDRRYIPAAIALQFTAIIAYGPFIGFVPNEDRGQPILPLPVVAIVQLAAVAWVVYLSFRPGRAELAETPLGATAVR